MRPFILSGIAAHTIVGQRIRLTAAPAFRELVSQESASLTPVQLIDLLQRFLLARLSDASVHDVVANALREIKREHGCLRVAEIAARCCVSPRPLNRLMRAWIGYGPKRLANVVRFQSTLMGGTEMARKVLGVVAGLAVWVAVATAAGLIMRGTWPAYARVADAMTFTLPMMFARLAIGAVATLAAGFVTAMIAALFGRDGDAGGGPAPGLHPGARHALGEVSGLVSLDLSVFAPSVDLLWRELGRFR